MFIFLRADEDEAEEEAPQVLTLSDLQREYAIARAHAIVAASMPSGEFTSSAPDDVFQHLLTLGTMRAQPHRVAAQRMPFAVTDGLSPKNTAGLHDAAFALAEAVYTGTRLARALEKVFAAMAAHAVHLQLQCGALGSEDSMLLGGGSGGQAAQRGDGQEATIPAAASAAAWQQLKKHLQRSVCCGGGWGEKVEWLPASYRGDGLSRCRFDGKQQQQTLVLVAVEAALSGDPRIHLPLWLTAPFKVWCCIREKTKPLIERTHGTERM